VVFTTQAVDKSSLPSTLPATVSVVNFEDKAEEGGCVASEDEGCPSCKSLPDGCGLLSEDVAHLSYISSHHPFPAMYKVIRNACVRSLSCELAPGREGPVFFTSGESYQASAEAPPRELGVLSYVYRITDNHARGSARWYSLLILHPDIFFIGQMMPWLTHCMRAIATDMQLLSQITAKESNTPLPAAIHPSMPLNRAPGSFRRAVRSVSLRSLVDLMNDHVWSYSNLVYSIWQHYLSFPRIFLIDCTHAFVGFSPRASGILMSLCTRYTDGRVRVCMRACDVSACVWM
jgi:hypothetical protein